MTLDQFLRIASKMSEYEFWLPHVSSTRCIRSKEKRGSGRFPWCPIEAVARQDNAFLQGVILGLSTYDTHLIIHAADGSLEGGGMWVCGEVGCTQEAADAFRKRMVEAFGLKE